MSVAPTAWPGLLHDTLLQSVSDVQICVEKPYLGLEPADAIPETDDNFRDFFWPEPDFCTTSFDVHIPARLQPELLNESEGVGAERFRVFTDYGWHGPCTFVSCLDGDAAARPDNAVRLVHAFVTRELKRSNSTLRMARVGPSPFHMVASIVPDLKLEDDLAFELVGVMGYRVYVFRYNPDAYANDDEAERAVQGAVSGQLQLFYELIRRSNRRSLVAESLSATASTLAAKHIDTGFVSWFNRVFRAGSEARKLALAAMQARLASVQDSEYARKYIQATLEETSALRAFGPFLEEACHDETPGDVDTAAEVAKLIEGSRSAEFEVVIIAGATLLGGLIGGLAGAGIAAGS